MKSKIFLLLIFFFSLSENVFSQEKNEIISAKITNIDFSDTKVTINYELPVGDFPNTPYQVSLSVKMESEEFDVVVGLSGDFGNSVQPSQDLTMVWDYTEEGFIKSDVSNSTMNIKGTRTVRIITAPSKPVLTENDETLKKVKLPSLIPMSSVTAVGLGVFGYGITKELSAQDDYTFYKENKIIDENYTVAMRDQYLEDAKSKRKTGFTVMAAGGAIATVGVLLLLKKIKARSEAKSKLSFQPEIKTHNNANTSIGMKIGFTF